MRVVAVGDEASVLEVGAELRLVAPGIPELLALGRVGQEVAYLMQHHLGPHSEHINADADGDVRA